MIERSLNVGGLGYLRKPLREWGHRTPKGPIKHRGPEKGTGRDRVTFKNEQLGKSSMGKSSLGERPKTPCPGRRTVPRVKLAPVDEKIRVSTITVDDIAYVDMVPIFCFVLS